MPELKTLRVFICHAWWEDANYRRLVNMLEEAGSLDASFKWQNYGVLQPDPVAIRANRSLEEALLYQIKPANIIVILSDMYASHKEWVQMAIDMASEMNKPIIGVKPWGEDKVPQAIQNVAKELVGWDAPSIVDAIRRNSL